MDPAHIGGDMSPLYVPRKRKSVQSQARGAPPCPSLQRIPTRQGELNNLVYPEDEESQDQNNVTMKRTYSKKRYEDLQNVSSGPVDFPTTSCSVMSTGGMANGSDERTINVPPRQMGKDVWPERAEASREQPSPEEQMWNSSRERGPEAWTPGREEPQDQVWSSGRDAAGRSGQEQTWMRDRGRPHQGADQAWITSQEQGSESGWGVGRDQSQDQAWNGGRDPERHRPSTGPEQGWGNGPSQDGQTWGDSSKERGNIWRPDLNMKKVQKAEVEPSPAVNTFLPPPEGSSSFKIPACSTDAASFGRSPAVQMNEDQKPVILPVKKEPPTYPPGSQEERWQLQIVAKGRVTCPKCKSVSRKTVEGSKKHMENCRSQPFTCQHCGKQLKSSTGMKYHIMADHSHSPSADDTKDLNDRAIKDKLRKISKRLGKLKCSKEGCTAAFTSIMGYVYHMKKCGKEESESEKSSSNCSHCGKTYKSKAGSEYHSKSEHAPTPQKTEENEASKAHREANPERTPSGRVQRASAQVANFHSAEIANNDSPKDWPKRKFQSDLVPDDKKSKYARPGSPAFSQEVSRKWKNEVKSQRKVHCPNQGCDCTYTSVSGSKAHSGLCTKGEFEAGKYRCLICNKEFNSESGVKYHINSVHSQDWFLTNKKASKKFEKFLKNQPKDFVHANKHTVDQYHYHHSHQQHHQYQQQQHYNHQQPSQQPSHPLQHQTQFLHPEQQDIHPQDDGQSQPELHYTPSEPPTGPMWLDMDRKEAVSGPEHIDMHMVDVIKSEEEGAEIMAISERIKGETTGETGMVDGKQTDCFGFSGGSLSEVEAALHRQHRIDQWDSKRPGVMEPHADAAK